ncbi:MAG: GDSL-type esterase/lipase family protein [Bacteroidia bacterium]|nr:GDSL-type esterase/lipase family protein [Bacteroidia bacterium]
MTKWELYLFFIIGLSGFFSCQNQPSKDNFASSKTAKKLDATAAPGDTIQIFTFERLPSEAENITMLPWAVRLEDLLAELTTPVKIVRIFHPSIPESKAILIPDIPPHIVVIDYGLEEAWAAQNNPQSTSNMPLPQFRERLRKLAESFHNQGIQVILLTPNPVQIPAAEWRNDRIDTYADAVREIANEFSFPVVDLQSSFGLYASTKGNLWSDLLIEGKYPNDIGHALIAEDVVATLSYILSSY